MVKSKKALVYGLLTWIALVGLVALLGIALAHGAVPGKKHQNSLGADIPYSNPYVYLMGSIADGAILQDEQGREFTNVRFHPYRTFALYDESVLFCGNVAAMFKGKDGAIVVTYRRTASRSLQGVGCHNLESVDKVEAKDEY